MHLNLVIVISPFAFKPGIQLPGIEPIFGDLVDSMPRHDCDHSKWQFSISFRIICLYVDRGLTVYENTAGHGRLVAIYHLLLPSIAPQQMHRDRISNCIVFPGRTA